MIRWLLKRLWEPLVMMASLALIGASLANVALSEKSRGGGAHLDRLIDIAH